MCGQLLLGGLARSSLLLSPYWPHLEQLAGLQLEALLLERPEDLAHQAPLDSFRLGGGVSQGAWVTTHLHHQECLLHGFWRNTAAD